MDSFEVARASLLSPMVTAFVLGMLATLVKSDLRIPDELYTTLTIYLLLAIGLKGGAGLATSSLDQLWAPLLATLLLGMGIPIWSYAVLRGLGRFDIANAAAIAAHYGSVSAVTFTASLAFLDSLGMAYEQFVPTLLTVLEVPAIVIALLLARTRSDRKPSQPATAPAAPAGPAPAGAAPVAAPVAAASPWRDFVRYYLWIPAQPASPPATPAPAQPASPPAPQPAAQPPSAPDEPGEEAGSLGAVLHEVLAGKSILLLLGGLVMGYLAGPEGLEQVKPFFVDPFSGALSLFLLDMGMVTARQLRDVAKVGGFLVGFGLIMPLIHGCLGILLGQFAGMSPGGSMVLGVLAASASYIAAPAAVRIALPQANPGYYLTASLGITFPFNLVIGLPIYYQVALWVDTLW